MKTLMFASKYIFVRVQKYLWVAILVGVVLCSLFASYLPIMSPTTQDPSNRLEPPRMQYPHYLGTDRLGQDVLSRLIWGGRVSLGLSISAVGLAVVVGLVLGIPSGYFRGYLDIIVMRIVEILLAFPSYIFAMLLVAVLGRSFVVVTIAIGIALSPEFTRLVRSEVLQIREETYIEGARATGASSLRIFLHHLFPNILAVVTTQVTIRFGTAILMESTLSFLGIGLPVPYISWGRMGGQAASFLFTAPWLPTIPGLVITLVVLAAMLSGDTLSRWVDPKARAGGAIR